MKCFQVTNCTFSKEGIQSDDGLKINVYKYEVGLNGNGVRTQGVFT